RRHVGLLGQGGNLADFDRAFEQRIGRSHPQMNERLLGACGHGPAPPVRVMSANRQATMEATWQTIQTKPATDASAMESRAKPIIGTPLSQSSRSVPIL